MLNWFYLYATGKSSNKRKVNSKSSHKSCFIKNSSLKFHIIHRKTHVLQLYQKCTSPHMFSRECSEIFKNTCLKNICKRLILYQVQLDFLLPRKYLVRTLVIGDSNLWDLIGIDPKFAILLYWKKNLFKKTFKTIISRNFLANSLPIRER